MTACAACCKRCACNSYDGYKSLTYYTFRGLELRQGKGIEERRKSQEPGVTFMLGSSPRWLMAICNLKPKNHPVELLPRAAIPAKTRCRFLRPCANKCFFHSGGPRSVSAPFQRLGKNHRSGKTTPKTTPLSCPYTPPASLRLIGFANPIA